MPETVLPVRKSVVLQGQSPAAVYAVVVDFPAYPRLFPEIKATRVLASDGRRVRAEFRGNVILPFRYVLDLDCNPGALTVDWHYVEGEVVKSSEGGWRFSPEGDGTRVDYRVAMAIAAPVPSFLLRKITDSLIALSLPAMFASIEREAKERSRTPLP
ncbi:MAG: SRPBCC family protein [Polyangia bacterium]